jgi:hypothetical protein
MEEIGQAPDDFASAFEAAFARFQVRVEEACAGSQDWAAGVAAAIRASLEFAAEDPATANTLTNGALAEGVDGIARRERLLGYLAEGLEDGRAAHSGELELPLLTERGVAGGLAGLVAERVATDRVAELPALAAEAIQFALTPYLGAAEAKRVAVADAARAATDR